jgi:uridine kinase
MHWEFIEPTKKFADIIIPQGGNNEKAIHALQMSIRYFLTGNR